MKKILVLNSGSSSIKFKLFDMDRGEKVLCSGLIERIGEKEARFKLKFGDKKLEKSIDIKDHAHGLSVLQEEMKRENILKSFQELGGVGHRVVHGGEYFDKAVLIDDSVLEKIEELSPLAPLHNPVNLLGIKAIFKQHPNIPQVAVFDTAFHQTIDKKTFMYALPYEYYEKEKIRRYGFHGTSHHFVMQKAAEVLQKDTNKINLITLHLGNGDSATAVKEGKSIDTSMGFTPLEGLVMGTRCGDLDPAIVFYLSKKLGLNIEELDKILNKKSGLKGICGDNDMREIEKRASQGDEKAKLALEVFCYRIKKYIGAYTVTIGKVDAIVFTGGIGENSSLVREMVCIGLEDSIGAKLDTEKNQKNELIISKNDSKIKILVIPTDEEFEIANQTYNEVANR
ncbi:MAG: acetate kinase [Epsilonproteobacteria bacterium]|nr:acetate kinase [Campylobacterota bacterium]